MGGSPRGFAKITHAPAAVTTRTPAPNGEAAPDLTLARDGANANSDGSATEAHDNYSTKDGNHDQEPA